MITSGQTAGQGLPQIRLRDRKQRRWFEQRPVRRRSSVWEGLTAVPPDELQLGQLLVGLEDGPLCEQFSQDAPVRQQTRAEIQLAAQPNRTDPTRQAVARHQAYPQLQTSMAGVYLSSPSSSSGGRYHNVMTLLVYGRLRGEKGPGLKASALAPAPGSETARRRCRLTSPQSYTAEPDQSPPALSGP